MATHRVNCPHSISLQFDSNKENQKPSEYTSTLHHENNQSNLSQDLLCHEKLSMDPLTTQSICQHPNPPTNYNINNDGILNNGYDGQDNTIAVNTYIEPLHKKLKSDQIDQSSSNNNKIQYTEEVSDINPTINNIQNHKPNSVSISLPTLHSISQSSNGYLQPDEWFCEDGLLMTTIRQCLIPDDNIEMLQWMLNREKFYHPHPYYLHWQKDISAKMRSILVDWMMEVASEFSLTRETFYIAVNMVDRICSSHMVLSRNQLQLVGTTNLFIASKLMEIYPPKASDFALTTDGAYTGENIRKMEKKILSTLQWSLLCHTPFSWVKLFIKRTIRLLYIHYYYHICPSTSSPSLLPCFASFTPAQLIQSMHQILLVDNIIRIMEILDAAILHIDSLHYYNSSLAAAALCIVHPFAVNFIQYISCISFQDLTGVINFLKIFATLPFRGFCLPSRPYFDMKIPFFDQYSRQLHFPVIIEFIQYLYQNPTTPN